MHYFFKFKRLCFRSGKNSSSSKISLDKILLLAYSLSRDVFLIRVYQNILLKYYYIIYLNFIPFVYMTLLKYHIKNAQINI